MTGSATETAFFPCLSGVCALVIERFRNREAVLRWWAWAAGGVTMGGMLIVLTATHATELHWGGDVLAFLTGTLGQTAYLFLVEDVLVRSGKSARGPIVTAQLMTMCVIGAVCLPFGIGTRPIHLILPHDIITCAAIGCVPILLQVFISPTAQRYVQRITVSCISSLEPLLAAMLATWFLGEQASPHVLLGEALVMMGIAMSLLCQLSFPRWKISFPLRHERAPSFMLDTV
ncbi:MAG TPA: EamA family transporter, partial [Ktedonobacteraceae bacterium]